MDAVIEILKEKKIKITPQRLAVYRFLYSSTEHPSVETIYKALEHDWPTLSLATIYKTLETLIDAGLAKRISIGCDRMLYDANTEPHCHLICVNCRVISDYLPLAIDDTEVNDLSEKEKFTPMYKEVNIYGVCEKCSRGDVNVR